MRKFCQHNLAVSKHRFPQTLSMHSNGVVRKSSTRPIFGINVLFLQRKLCNFCNFSTARLKLLPISMLSDYWTHKYERNLNPNYLLIIKKVAFKQSFQQLKSFTTQLHGFLSRSSKKTTQRYQSKTKRRMQKKLK